MKLRRLRIEHFKRFREPFAIEGFDDGLNLFAAPNEAGKSTIAEAIRAAFFERHRSGSVDHLRPWGETSATPTVEVEFDLAGRHYRLTKAFLGRKRCELVVDGREMDGVAAEDHLAALLGFRFPGKGASTPEHMGIPGLLWIRQGTSHELADAVSHAADHLRQVLGEALGGLTSSSGDALLGRVKAARDELLTPATGNPRGAYAEALQRRQEGDEAIAALTRDILAYQASVDRLAALQREHQRDEQQRPWAAMREQHQAALARLEAAQGLEARQAAELASLRQWSAQVGALRSQVDAFAREDAAVATRGQAVQAAAAAEAAAQFEAQAWERRHLEAAQADTEARRQLERVRAAASRAEAVRTADDLESSLRTLGDALARARDERSRVTRLQAEAATLEIAPADLKKARALSETLRDVAVRLDSVATTLEFELLDGALVRLAGEAVSGRSRRTIVRRTEVDIAGLGRITVSPGGADLDSLAAQRDGLAAELGALLARLGVASVADAEERARLGAQRGAEAKAGLKLLEALAPNGVEALEADVAARSSRLAQVRAAIAAMPPASPDEPGLPAKPQAQAEAERARSALEAAAAALDQARVLAARAQSAATAARQELAAAEATVADSQRLARVASAQRDLADALAQEAAARQRADAAAGELKAVNLGLLQQDAERLAGSARQLEEHHDRRRDEITRLEVELQTKGALGLEEQRAERQRDLERAARRAEELSRRAAALDHLLELLRDRRAELARRLRAPLQRHLDRYVRILFPGAHVEVADDLSPGAITRPGPRGAESGGFEQLSVGAREQMGVVARLAYADLLQEAGRPTLLILDDALVHTDEDRLGQMKRVLYDAAARHQLLIFTCHPAAWRDLGVPVRSIGG